MSEIETRNSQVAEVSYPKRTVTVVVAPYDTPSEVKRPGRSWTEIVSRGAFDGVQRRAGSIRANRDHDWSRLVGKLTALYPDSDEGLVADVRMFKTQIGEETLELCAEDGLSASMGFEVMRENGRPKPDAEVWDPGRKVRRLNSVHLDHVAFVPDPVASGARVLDVRHADPVEAAKALTPNLDRLATEQLRAQLAAMNARWGV